MQKPQCSMHRLLIIFQDFLTFFLATFFQKEVSKDHSTQGNLLKTTLLNEKQNNLENKKCMEISLYTPSTFHLGQEVMFTKHTFTS